MKRCVLVLLWCSLVVNAQEHFFNRSNFWIEYRTLILTTMEHENPYDISPEYIMYVGDTVIENKKYQNYNDSYFLREDNGKIWLLFSGSRFYPNQSAFPYIETMVCDYNLNIGDSLSLSNPVRYQLQDKTYMVRDTIVVTAIDSIELLNGNKLKRIWYDCGYPDIEHLGNMAGLGYWIDRVSGANTLHDTWMPSLWSSLTTTGGGHTGVVYYNDTTPILYSVCDTAMWCSYQGEGIDCKKSDTFIRSVIPNRHFKSDKNVIDGQVYILREGVLYDLTGRAVR